jgi:hypothetical protein
MKDSAAPFVIMALSRSRTAWLARFLTYGDYSCSHEQAPFIRSLDDIKAWLSQDLTGASETAVAPFWRLIRKYRPDTRIVTIRRPVEEVVESFLAVDMHGTVAFDRASLTKRMKKLNAKLDQIEARVPDVLSIDYEDLRREEVCSMLFRHCLPHPHDNAWWQIASATNIQCSVPAMIRYVFAHRFQLEKTVAQTKQRILADIHAAKPVHVADGLTIQCEPFDDAYRDGQRLFAEHCSTIGEGANSFSNKNIELLRTLDGLGALQMMTARSNGRMFGYLMTVLSPSFETPNMSVATHMAFYASPDFPGLGLKLQRASLDVLRQRDDIGKVFFRAGVRRQHS